MALERCPVAVDALAPDTLARFWSALLDRPGAIREEAVTLSVYDSVEFAHDTPRPAPDLRTLAGRQRRTRALVQER